ALRLRRDPRRRGGLLSSGPDGTSRSAPARRHVSVLLDARGLTKRYGDFTALDGVSLTVSEGEFVSIIGPNGAGKTTLVNIVTGLALPPAGQMSCRVIDLDGAGPVTLARRGLARGFQLVTVFPALPA